MIKRVRKFLNLCPLLLKVLDWEQSNVRVLRRFVKRDKKELSFQTFWASINCAKTKAYCFGTLGQIFFNYNLVKSTIDREELLKHLVGKLFELQDPADGQNIVDKVLGKNDIYSGQYLDEAPDIVCFMRNMTYASYGWLVGNQLVVRPARSGTHRMKGILVMRGSDLKKGHILKGSCIVDLAPTILYHLGLQIPSDVDGRVLLEAFLPSFVESHAVRMKKMGRRKARQLRPKYSDEEESKVKERLKALGYL